MRKMLVVGILLIVLGVALGGFSAFMFSRASDMRSLQQSNEARAARLLVEAEAVKASDPERSQELASDAERSVRVAEADAADYRQRLTVALLSAAGALVLCLIGLVLSVAGRRSRRAPVPVPAYGPPPPTYPPPPGYAPQQPGR
jgi:hypothetical protein